MLTASQFLVVSILLSAICGIIAMFPQTEGDSRWMNIGATLIGIFFLGNLLYTLLPPKEVALWCTGYALLIGFGYWFMRAGAKEYLRTHASEYVHTTFDPR